MAAAVRPLPAVDLPIASCDGLVLAQGLVARCDLPSFDTSAMDGWALAGPGPWVVVGSALAGRPSAIELRSGEAVEIATGGAVPEGADAVLRSEDGQVDDGPGAARTLRGERPTPGMWIRPSGEECRAGEVLAGAGTVVTPALVGLAAASGHDHLTVIPRPSTALVIFGDELVTAGVPGPGLVRDSLGPQVPAWLARMGVEVLAVEHAEDTLAAHVDAIGRWAQEVDLVLTTGGTASGPVDHLHAAIAGCGGEILVDSVAVRPGHPMLAGAVGGRSWLVGLPGNPQSAIVTLMTLAAPIIDALSGRPAVVDLPRVRAGAPIGAPPHEDRLVLGSAAGSVFHPGAHLGSGMLRGLASAQGFAVVPPGGVQAGATLRWLPLPP